MSFPRAVLITGVSASGKSTVAQLLAERLPRSVHLRGDWFRRIVVNDQSEMRPDPSTAALDQLRLRYRLTVGALEAYVQAGFTVVAQDVVLGPLLDEFIATVSTRPFAVVVLAPSLGVVASRERQREKEGYQHFTVEQLDAVLREETPRRGLWLDTSQQSADETVAEILRRIVPDGFV